MLSEYDCGFLEAALDTDGYFSISTARGGIASEVSKLRFPHRFVPVTGWKMTSKAFLEKVKGICGDGVVAKESATSYTKRQCYRYNMTRATMRRLLPQLQLVAKDGQRILMLEALDLLHTRGIRMEQESWSRLSEIRDTIMELNKYGYEW